MKKKLLILGVSLFLVGCSNDKKEVATSIETTESSEIKIPPSEKFGFTAESILSSNFNELMDDEFKKTEDEELEGVGKVEVISNNDETVSILLFTKKDETELSAYSVVGNRNKKTISHDKYLLAMKTLQASESKESKEFRSTWGPDIQSTDVSISSFNSEISSGELERFVSSFLSDKYTKTTKSSEPKLVEKKEVPTEYSNALSSARKYLKVSGFSKVKLKEQLIYEKYSDEAANYAVENVTTDWNANAVKVAENYLKISSFSKDSLLEQMLYDGFTNEQANRAVDAVYKD